MEKSKSVNFHVSGMHCVACAKRLEKKLGTLNGLHKYTVNFTSNYASVTFNPSIVQEKDIIAIANTMGYTLTPEQTTNQSHALLKEMILVVIAWLFSLALIAPMLVGHHLSANASIIIAGLSILIPGFTILKGALSSILSGIMGMDVLIALGAIAAWASSLLALIGLDVPNYSMTASMLIAVNLTGRFLESFARGRASQAVTKLANFTGKHAYKKINDEFVKVNVADLQIMDIIKIKAGEKIPTDCKILEGTTSADESFITGESLPVNKEIGSYLYGGAINIDGTIIAQVEKDATNNILSQTIKLIQEAQNSQIPIQILADKVTSIFVPIILTISFVCFALWFAFPEILPNWFAEIGISFGTHSRLANALSASIAVLVIACPCALGLATPISIMNGSALGAHNGILIKKGEAIQNLCDIDVVALDKTGTLTMGKPQIQKIMFPLANSNALSNELIQILYGLEKNSNHPLAHAISIHAENNNISSVNLQQITTIPGQGISGLYNNQEWFAGSLKATQEKSYIIPEDLLAQADTQLNLGETLICLTNTSTGNCQLIVSLSDTLNPEALECINALHKMNKKVIMVTGDHQKSAQNIANQLNISSVLHDCSPKHKLEIIKSLQQQNYKVCFIGDGINDAAALEAANVGIAIGTGTDIASESGDVILVNGSLSSLIASFKLAQVTFDNIKQNLFWAFFYNFVAIPIAFAGLLHPVVAEIAMSFSSLTVIFNSSRLKGKKLH